MADKIRMQTENSTYLRREGDKEIWKAEIMCDNCTDLIGVTGQGNKIFAVDSVALAVKDGEVCVLASDNKWYKQSSGTEVTA